MKEYPCLIIPTDDFVEKVKKIISVGKSLLNKKVETEDSLTNFSREFDLWEADAIELLQSSFIERDNAFYYEFCREGNSQKNLSTQIPASRPLDLRVNDYYRFLQTKIDYLNYNLRIILACDFISTGDNSIKETRKYFSTQQKLSFLLDRLYQLNDGEYYPVEMLLKGNGIFLKYPQEARELIQMLEDNEYVTSLGGAGSEISARITSSGSMYYEETQTIQADTITSEAEPEGQEDINKRVDDIIEYLKNLGLGQEILFEELQELKLLYSKLNKKNWLQVLKGKILDIAVDKLTDTETIQLIYKKLTGDDLRLLS